MNVHIRTLGFSIGIGGTMFRGAKRYYRLGRVFLLLAIVLSGALPAASGPGTGHARSDDPAGLAPAAPGGEATLEASPGGAQWSPAGAPDWFAPAGRQPVRGGDRVRTSPGGAARLVYADGSATMLAADGGLLIQRLEGGP